MSLQYRKKNNTFFKLYACCIPVSGVGRAIIYDLQRRRYDLIPLDLFEILNSEEELSLDYLVKKHGIENKPILLEYIMFLENKEYIFYYENWEKDFFPKIAERWDSASLITNSIIDVNKNSNHDFETIFKQTDPLGCFHFQIRFFDETSKKILNKIASIVNKSRIKSIELILPETKLINVTWCKKFSNSFFRFNNIILHSAKKNEYINESLNSAKIFRVKEKINSPSDCHKFGRSYFQINESLFFEGLQFNTYYNRKLTISSTGQIKNCTSLTKSFGNIKTVKIESIVSSSKFQEIWKIHKNLIKNCNLCEYRYMCVDSRSITKDNNIYSSDSDIDCGYNPYLMKWKTEKGYSKLE